MKDGAIVYVVDDDAAMRASVEWVCRSQSLACVSYPSAEAFNQDTKPEVPSCLVLDLRLDGECGLDIVQGWRSRGEAGMPVIVVTGAGDVPLAVQSLKLGAMDFLEKPADPQVLLARLKEALANDKRRREKERERSEIRQRLAELTQRERELLKLVCNGLSNKQIGQRLKISVKTVANHRAHVMAKAKAVNTADMVRLATMLNDQ
jgi:RNA polymerase sigma factor (sigma-70 family)